jgi:hypothetical protein
MKEGRRSREGRKNERGKEGRKENKKAEEGGGESGPCP